MAQVSILANRSAPGKIDTIELDCVISEGHDLSTTVTDFPVESGFTITDHIIRQPLTLHLEACVSNSHISPAAADAKANKLSKAAAISPTGNSKSLAGADRVAAAFAKLRNLAGYPAPGQADSLSVDPAVFTVVTGLCVYDNMVITRLSVPRKADDGDSITFSADFRKVRVVNTSTAVALSTSDLGGIAPFAALQGMPTVNLAFTGAFVNNAISAAQQAQIDYNNVRTDIDNVQKMMNKAGVLRGLAAVKVPQLSIAGFKL